MSVTAIRVENLSKRYRIGKNRAAKPALKQRLVGPFEYLLSTLREPDDDEVIWALKDVSFEIQSGEVVGLIGRNGSGKSTLLKLLSRITEPTSGEATIRGRVGSLLEVGTGFHPELTGRENIYLSGAILGMNRAELDRKFDEIVSFSGVERFIDTPVKRYSSGMKVRLGFSVAAHLEPEILLIDEVLAVGDYEFQKRCLGKMSEVSQEGRTVLFVSHDTAAVTRLCQRAILLQAGEIALEGDSRTVVREYLSQGDTDSGFAVLHEDANAIAHIRKVGIQDASGHFTARLGGGDAFDIWIELKVNDTIRQGQLACDILAEDGQCAFVTTHADARPLDELTLTPGVYRARVRIPGQFLNVGVYTLEVRLTGDARGERRQVLTEALRPVQFRIDRWGSLRARMRDKRRGLVTPLYEWQVEKTPEDSLQWESVM